MSLPTQLVNDTFIGGLPDSVNFDPQVQTIGKVSDTQLQAELPLIQEELVLCNIPNLTEPILDLLAFQYQVLFYQATNNITNPVARVAAKRALLASNFYVHAHLGTAGVMQPLISSIWSTAIIQEWFVYGGSANHFRILTPVVLTTAIINQITPIINVMKRCSQAFDGFYTNVVSNNQIFITLGVFSSRKIQAPVAH